MFVFNPDYVIQEERASGGRVDDVEALEDGEATEVKSIKIQIKRIKPRATSYGLKIYV